MKELLLILGGAMAGFIIANRAYEQQVLTSMHRMGNFLVSEHGYEDGEHLWRICEEVILNREIQSNYDYSANTTIEVPENNFA